MPDAARCVELDWVDPVDVFRRAAGIPGCVWLDSGGGAGESSRWSSILIRPLETLEVRVGAGAAGNGREPDAFRRLQHLHASWSLRAAAAGSGAPLDASPQALLHGAFADAGASSEGRTSVTASTARPPFTGGVVAILGYDLGRCLERLPSIAADDPKPPPGLRRRDLFDCGTSRTFATSWGIAARAQL
jgi:hypothetical protein